MRRSFLASLALHAGLGLVVFLLGLFGPDRSDLPPVYQVNLVQAADLTAPEPRRPEPTTEPEPEEEPPEPEALEKIPDPEEEPPAEEEPEPAETEETPEPGPEAGEAEGADLPLTLEGQPFEFPWYLEQLVRKVQRNWRPGGGTLKTTIYFRITSSGKITEVRTEESSGSSLFDRAAERAVRASDPMPPLPPGYTGDYLGVYFDFDTSVRPSG